MGIILTQFSKTLYVISNNKRKHLKHVINHLIFGIQSLLQRAPGIARTGRIVVHIKMGLDAREPDFDAWEQQ